MEQSHIYTHRVIGLALIAAFGFIIGLALLGHYFYQGRIGEHSVSVAGSAQQVITSDVAKWQANFTRTTDAQGLKDGNTKINQDLQRVQEFMKTNGIAENDIHTDPVSITPDYDDQTDAKSNQSHRVFTGYTLSQNVTVESHDIDTVTKAAKDSSNLIDQGIIFNSTGIEYYYSKLADLKVSMLANASKDARNRAAQIAQNSGADLGRLQSAKMGVFQITSVNSTDLSDEGAYDTSSIQKQITAIVRASYLVR